MTEGNPVEAMHKLAQGEGYNGSIEDFQQLLKDDPKALGTMYNVALNNGYEDSFPDFEILMGLKKKEEAVTESALEDGLSERKLASYEPEVRAYDARLGGIPGYYQADREPYPYDTPAEVAMRDSAMQAYDETAAAALEEEAKRRELEAAKISRTLPTVEIPEGDTPSVLSELNRLYGRFGFQFQESDGLVKVFANAADGTSVELTLEVDEEGKIPASEANKLDPFIRQNAQRLSVVDETLAQQSLRARNLREVPRVEGDEVSTVKMAYGDVDGKFVAYPTLFPKDPNNYGTSSDDWVEKDFGFAALDEAMKRNEVFYFDTEEEAADFAGGNWKTIDEQDLTFEKMWSDMGRNYWADQAFLNELDKRREEFLFLEALPGAGIRYEEDKFGFPVEEIPEEYKGYFLDGNMVRDDINQIIEQKRSELQGLEDRLGGDLLDLKEKRDEMLNARFKQLSSDAAEMNRDAQLEQNRLEASAMMQFGLPLNELFEKEPETQAELANMMALYNDYSRTIEQKRFAATSYERAQTFYNKQHDKSLTDEYVDGWEEVTVAWDNGWKRGEAMSKLLLMQMGYYDAIGDPEAEKEAMREVSQIMNSIDPRTGRVVSRANATGTSNSFAQSLARNPALYTAAITAESLGQLLPLWKNVALPIGAVGGAVGAAAGGVGALPGVASGFLTGAAVGFFNVGMPLSELALEMGNAVLDTGERMGYNWSDPNSSLKALEDEKMWSEATERGLERGIPISAMGALSNYFIGRAVGGASQFASLSQRVGRGALTGLVVEPITEGLGETAALMTSGEFTGSTQNLKEIAAESIGAIGMGIGMGTSVAGFHYAGRVLNDTNFKLAHNLLSPEFLAKQEESNSRIVAWTNKMEKLGKITSEQAEGIRRNVGRRRKANELLGKPLDAKPGNDATVIGRIIKLLEAKEELEASGESVFSEKIREITEEIATIAERGKVLKPGEGAVSLSDIEARIRKRRPGSYKFNGRNVTKQDFLEKIKTATPRQLRRAKVYGDPETLFDLAYAIQKRKAAKVPLGKQPGGSAEVEQEVSIEPLTQADLDAKKEDRLNPEREVYIVGQVADKVARGEALTDVETQYYETYKGEVDQVVEEFKGYDREYTPTEVTAEDDYGDGVNVVRTTDVPFDAKQQSVLRQAQRSVASLAKRFPQVKFILHDSDASYQAAYAKASPGKKASGSGFYVWDDKAVHVNLADPNLKLTTVPHETFHAILRNSIGSADVQVLMKDFVTTLKKVIDEDSDLARDLAEFQRLYDEGQMDEEFVAEFFGRLTEAFPTLNREGKTVIARFLERLGKLIGFDLTLPKNLTARDKQILELLERLSGKVATGEAITKREQAEFGKLRRSLTTDGRRQDDGVSEQKSLEQYNEEYADNPIYQALRNSNSYKEVYEALGIGPAKRGFRQGTDVRLGFDFSAAMSALAQNPNLDEDYKLLAESVLVKFIKAGMDDSKQLPLVQSKFSKNFIGVFDYGIEAKSGRVTDMRIRLSNPDNLPAEYRGFDTMAETLIHEGIHAVSGIEIVFSPTGTASEFIRIARTIRRWFQDPKNQQLVRKKHPDFMRRFIINGMLNQATLPHEVVTYGLTNRAYQEVLKLIPDPNAPKQNLWNRFVNTIRQALGLSVNEGTVLDSILYAYTDTKAFLVRDRVPGYTGAANYDMRISIKPEGEFQGFDADGVPEVRVSEQMGMEEATPEWMAEAFKEADPVLRDFFVAFAEQPGVRLFLNPIGGGFFYANQEKGSTELDVRTSIYMRDGGVHLDLLEVITNPKSQGAGTRFMQDFVSALDATNAEANLMAWPPKWYQQGMSEEEMQAISNRLKAFYGRFGFTPNRFGDSMTRKPGAGPVEVTEAQRRTDAERNELLDAIAENRTKQELLGNVIAQTYDVYTDKVDPEELRSINERIDPYEEGLDAIDLMGRALTPEQIEAINDEYGSGLINEEGFAESFEDFMDSDIVDDYYDLVVEAQEGRGRLLDFDGGISEQRNSLETDGTGINLEGNEEVQAGDVSPTVMGTQGQLIEDFRLSDMPATITRSTAAAIGAARRFASGKITYKKDGKKVEVTLPYRNKKLQSLLNRRVNALKKTSNKAKRAELFARISETTQQIFDGMVDAMAQNVLAVYDTLTPEFVQASKEWYVGANRTANELARMYNLTVEQAAGILAALSPQNEWFNNIAVAERVIEVMTNHRDTPFSQEILDKAVAKNTTKGKPSSWANDLIELYGKHQGKTLNQLQAEGVPMTVQSILLRAIDQALYPGKVAMTTPDGDFFAFDSTPIRWSSPVEIAKSMDMFLNPDIENIRTQLGKGNKVRNFYNNIVDPRSANPYVTADTHAAAVALGVPMSSEDAGGIGLFNGGQSMVYMAIKEAYIRAAEVAGIQPREMQSITWEAVRTGLNNKNRSKAQIQSNVTKLESLLDDESMTPYERARRIIIDNRTENPGWATQRGIEAQIPDLRQGVREQAESRASEVLSLRGRPGRDVGAADAGVGVEPSGVSEQQAVENLRLSEQRAQNFDSRRLRELSQDGVLAHFTSAEFEQFKPGFGRVQFFGEGIYFTNEKVYASRFSDTNTRVAFVDVSGMTLMGRTDGKRKLIDRAEYETVVNIVNDLGAKADAQIFSEVSSDLGGIESKLFRGSETSLYDLHSRLVDLGVSFEMARKRVDPNINPEAKAGQFVRAVFNAIAPEYQGIKNRGDSFEDVVIWDFDAINQNIVRDVSPEYGVSEQRTIDSTNGTFLIPVDSDVSSVAQIGFDPKSETHVTIIGFPNGRKVMRAVKQNPAIEQAVNRLIARSDFRFTPTGRAFEIEKEYAAYRDRNTGQVITPAHTRQALIEEVEMPGLARFYGELSELIGEELAVPYPHISLGTRLDPRGIGINSVAEFEALNPKPVTLPQTISYETPRVSEQRTAPNGQPSNLNEVQYDLVRTPEFKSWFGDWEQAYRTGNYDGVSKIIDENGEPMVVYHGSIESNIKEFSKETAEKRRVSGLNEDGVFFSSNRNLAEDYARGRLEGILRGGRRPEGLLLKDLEETVYAVFLDMKNPYRFDGKGQFYPNYYKNVPYQEFRPGYGKSGKYAVRAYLGNNTVYQTPYDGVVAENVIDYHDYGPMPDFDPVGDTIIVPFSSKPTIKLADGSNTTFSSASANISEQRTAPERPKPTAAELRKLRSPEFKAWFGDWENDPENASKVVDANGFPLKVYHAGESEIQRFFYEKTMGGFFFTPRREDAENFAKEYRPTDSPFVGEYYLNIRDPKFYEKFYLSDTKESYTGDAIEQEMELAARLGYERFKMTEYPGRSRKLLNRELMDEGIDGINIAQPDWEDSIGTNSEQWVAFFPNSIKSTDAKTFDSSSPNVSEQRSALEAMSDPNDSMHDIVRKGREALVTDEAIVAMLVNRYGRKSLPAIRKAMDMNTDTFTAIPKEFGNVEGGIIEGRQIFEEVRRQLQQFMNGKQEPLTKQNRQRIIDELREQHPEWKGFSDTQVLRKRPLIPPTKAEVRAEAKRLLESNARFQKQTPTVQDALVVAFDKSLNTRANKDIQNLISQIRRDIRQRNRGAKERVALQRRVRALMRDVLPNTDYNRRAVNSLLSVLNEINEKNFYVKMGKLMDEVDAARERQKEQTIRRIEKLVARAAKTTKTSGGRVRTRGLDAPGQAFFAQAKIVLDAIRSRDKAAIDDIIRFMEESKSLEYQDALESYRAGLKLNRREQELIDRMTAFDLFADLNEKNLEQVEAILEDLLLTEGFSRVALKQQRLANAARAAAIRGEASADIRRNYGSLILNAKGEPMDDNELGAKRSLVRKLWQKDPYKSRWQRLKDMASEMRQQSAAALARRGSLVTHLGTYTSILGEFFFQNIYEAVNGMEENYLRGLQDVQKTKDDIANSIEGIDNGFSQIARLIFSTTEKTTLTTDGMTRAYHMDELMRLYALSLNPDQRRKLLNQGFDEGVMQTIKDTLGPQLSEYAEKIAEYLGGEYYEGINDVYSELNNINLPHVENYFPTRSLTTESVTVGQAQNIMGYASAQTASALKERTNMQGPVELGAEAVGIGFVESLDNHLRSMERFKAYALGTRDINTIMSTPEFRTLLKTFRGNGLMNLLVNHAVDPEKFVSPLSQGTKVANWLISRYTMSVLFFKAWQAVKQASSAIMAFTDYKYKPDSNLAQDLIMFSVDAAVLTANLAAEMATLGKYKGPLREAMDISATLENRVKRAFAGEVYSLESGVAAVRNPREAYQKTKKAYALFRAVGGAFTSFGDIMGVMGYMVNYRRDIKNGMNPDEALAKFNSYNMTQQSRRPADRVPIQIYQNALSRMVVAFMSTSLLYLNNTLRHANNILRAQRTGQKVSGADIRGLAMNGVFGHMIYQAVANLFLLLQGDDEDKEKFARVVATSPAANIFAIPILGDLIETVFNELQGNNYRSTIGVNPFERPIKNFSKAIKEEEYGKAAADIAAYAVGANTDFAGAALEISQGEDVDENIYELIGVPKSARPE